MDISTLTDEQVVEIAARAAKVTADLKIEAEFQAQNAFRRQQVADERQRESVESQLVAEQRLERDRQTLTRPTSLAAYHSLSPSQKVAYVSAFGEDFPRQVAAVERSGLDWQSFDRMSAEATKRQQERIGAPSSQVQGETYSRLRAQAEYRASNKSLYDQMMEDERKAARLKFGLPEDEAAQ
jgi:hypothetical protein